MSKRSVVATLVIAPLIVAAMVIALASPAVAGHGDRTMYFEGTGQALIYPFWTVTNTDTLFEIVNRISPLIPKPQDGIFAFDGPATGGRPGRWVKVHFIVHEEKNSEDVADFNVCLSPGDVWTGALTLSGGVTKLVSTGDTSAVSTSLPLSLSPDSSGANPLNGYIEAVMIDNGTTEKGGCDGDQDTSGDPAKFFGPDTLGVREPLFGREIFINVGGGIASGFNAEALEDLDPDFELLLGSIKGSWHAFENLALGEEDDSIVGTLMGRWSRSAPGSPVSGINTQVVVTFPTGKDHVFSLCDADYPGLDFSPFGTTNCGAKGKTVTKLDFTIGKSSTMALWIRNDEECVNSSPRQIPVPNEVNIIDFGKLEDRRFNVGDCDKPESPAEKGWFRLLFDKNGEDEITDFVAGVWNDGTDNHTVRVPRVIPAVGLVTITAPTATARITATFPFQTERPFERYDCDSGHAFADFLGCD